MTRLVFAVVALLLFMQVSLAWAAPHQPIQPASIGATTTTTTAPSTPTCTTTPATTPAPDATPEVRLRRPGPPPTTAADLPPSSADVALPDARGPPGPGWAQAAGSIAPGGGGFSTVGPKPQTFGQLRSGVGSGGKRAGQYGFHDVDDFQRAWAELAVQERAPVMRSQLGRAHGFGETYGIGVVRGPQGMQLRVASKSPYGVGNVNKQLLPGEELVGRRLPNPHAEIQVHGTVGAGEELLGIGATRPVCPNCQLFFDSRGIPIWTPRK